MKKLKKNNFLKQALSALVIGSIACVLALAISQTKFARLIELKSYDARMNALKGFRPAPENVVMFYVDEPSLRHMESQGVNWPWPRETYAMAIDFCKRGGAKAILFDIFYSEDSVYGVADDAAFGDAIMQLPNYFVLFLSDSAASSDDRIVKIFQKSRFNVQGEVPQSIDSYESLSSIPIAPIVDAARGFGNAQVPPDEDGVFRKLPLLSRIGNEFISAISFKVAADILGTDAVSFTDAGDLRLGGKIIPLDADASMLLNYYGGADTFPVKSLAQVMFSDMQLAAQQKPDLSPEIVKDKVVIIGVAAPGLYDTKPTPLAKVYPAPEVHATAIENILRGDFIVPYSGATAIAMTALFSFAASAGLAIFSSSLAIFALLALLALSLGGVTVAGFSYGNYLPFAVPAIALFLSSFISVLKNYLTEGRKRRQIKSAFKQYLSPHVVAEISKDPDSLKLGGIETEVTLFFSDIADFTTISESTQPTELVKKLNEYFSLATNVIQSSGGTLDKYIGDAIMAFWGAPLITSDHAEKAAMSAMEIQKELQAKSEFITRIGIHTGPAVVGNIGSDIRFNYTAIGDTVNLASRLEGLNKKFGTRVILSETTFEKCKRAIEARRIGKVRVKGRSAPIGIFEPLGPKGSFGKLSAEACAEFSRALDLFESAKFEESEKLFQLIAKKFDDEVSKKYAGYCFQYRSHPDDGFDGVINFSTK